MFRCICTLNTSSRSFSKLAIAPSRRFTILPDADDLAQGRTRERALRVDARTCVTVAVPACCRARGKDVSCSDSNTIPRDEFFKINLLSAVSVSSRCRLARIAYARFSPPHGRGCSRRTHRDSVWLDDTSVR